MVDEDNAKFLQEKKQVPSKSLKLKKISNKVKIYITFYRLL